ncbi:MAG: CBS domain-containing protein [Polyangiaceae bacterium]
MSTLHTIMRRSLIVISEDATVEQAIALARSEHLHHLPVVRGATVVGLVCTCDLASAALERPVELVMSHPAVALQPAATLLDAALAMNEHDVGSVVVMEGGSARGIVTRGDLLLARPELEDVLGKARCSCCGLTRHLRTDEHGDTLCVYCLEPGGDGLAADLI